MTNNHAKPLLRTKLLDSRRLMRPEKVKSISSLITEKCIDNIDWKNISSVQVYLPIPARNEIATWQLLRFLWDSYEDLITAVPVIRNGHLYSATISNSSILKPAKYDIPEPQDPKILPADHQFDIIIIPVLGFDISGYRLGYGQGYYDKFLVNQSGLKAGLAYEQSKVMPQLPHENHDIPLNIIITEQKTYKF